MTTICAECRYIDNRLSVTAAGSKCNHPGLTSIVTGKTEPMLCSQVRTDTNRCGPEGRWFQSAPELPEELRP